VSIFFRPIPVSLPHPMPEGAVAGPPDGSLGPAMVLATLLVAPLLYFLAFTFWERDHIPHHELQDPPAFGAPSVTAAPRPSVPKPLRDLPGWLRGFLFEPPDAAAGRHFLLRPAVFQWYGFIFVLYGLLTTVSVGLGLKRHPKTPSDVAEDIECLLLRGVTLLVVGVNQRLAQPHQRPLFLTLTLYSVLMYSLLFHYAPKVSFHGGQMDINMLVTLAFVAGIVGTVLAHHVVHVCRLPGHGRWLYCAAFAVIAVLVVLGASHAKMHVHHYWWGWVLAHFFTVSSKASIAAQACCVALFVHGVAMFGCDPLFPGACGS